MTDSADTTQESAPTESVPQDVVAAQVATEQTPAHIETAQDQTGKWMVAPDTPGQGDKPEWFKENKYKTVSDQAQAYVELESKFGSFTGAPENYEINISEALTEKGIEFNSDDPIMEEAFKFAQEAGMNQEGFDNMMNLYGMSQLAQGEAIEAYKEEQIKELGPSGQARLDNISAWANTNLSSEQVEGLQGMATSVKSVETIEQLIAMTRPSAMAPSEVTPTSANTESDVKAMQFEKDVNGNRRIQTDPAFKKEYEKMRDEVYGTEPKRTLIA